jgi:hypothetical protein
VTASRLYRIAAIVFVLFAAGHTFGFLSFKPPTSEGLAVRDAMYNVRFTVQGSSFSYGNFYRGFGLAISANTLLMALFSWQLGSLARSAPGAARILGWGLCATQLFGVVLSWMYYSIVPTVLSAALALLLATAASKTRGAIKVE